MPANRTMTICLRLAVFLGVFAVCAALIGEGGESSGRHGHRRGWDRPPADHLPDHRARQHRGRSQLRDDPGVYELTTGQPDSPFVFDAHSSPIDDNGQTLPQFNHQSPSPNVPRDDPEETPTTSLPRNQKSSPNHRLSRRRRRHGHRNRRVHPTVPEIIDYDTVDTPPEDDTGDTDSNARKASGDELASEENVTYSEVQESYLPGVNASNVSMDNRLSGQDENSTGGPYSTSDNGGVGENTVETASHHPQAPPGLDFEQWMWRERNKQARLFMIQTRILQKLGLRRQPNFTKPILSEDQRRRMVAIYEQNLDEESERSVFDRDDFFAKRLQFKTPSCDLPRNTRDAWRDGHHFRLYFPFTNQPRPETRVSAASLRLYKKPIKDGCDCHLSREGAAPDGATDSSRRARHLDHRGGRPDEQEDIALDDLGTEEEEKVRISVFYYSRPVRPKRKEKVKMVDSIMVAKSFEGWVKLNVKTAVSAWHSARLRNFGMVVRVEDVSERQLDAFSVFTPPNCSVSTNASQNSLPFAFASVADDGDLVSNQSSPLLDIVTIGVSASHQVERQRREAVHRRSCVWEGVYVSFDDLGWSDWVLQPLGFQAGFCRGTCATATNDRELKSVAYKKNKFTHFECCGPSKLKSLQIIHYDKKGKLQISIFDNFIVTDCGCRP